MSFFGSVKRALSRPETYCMPRIPLEPEQQARIDKALATKDKKVINKVRAEIDAELDAWLDAELAAASRSQSEMPAETQTEASKRHLDVGEFGQR